MGSIYTDGGSGWYWKTYTADDTAGNSVEWGNDEYKITTNVPDKTWEWVDGTTIPDTLANPLDKVLELIKKSFPEFWEQNMYLPEADIITMLLERLKRLDGFLDRLGIEYKGEEE